MAVVINSNVAGAANVDSIYDIISEYDQRPTIDVAGSGFSYAAGTTNKTIITITLEKQNGEALDYTAICDVYLSDDSGGHGVSATASDAMDVEYNSDAANIGTNVADLSYKVLSSGAGVISVEVESAANTLYYPSVAIDRYGVAEIFTGAQLQASDYGS